MWYITTPRLKTSALWSYAYFLIISGLRYNGVPTYLDLTYFSLLTIVLSLKSPNFIFLSFVIRTFNGFKSLCIISCEWQCNKAKQSCHATCQISNSEKYFRFCFCFIINVCMSPFSAISIAMKRLLACFRDCFSNSSIVDCLSSLVSKVSWNCSLASSLRLPRLSRLFISTGSTYLSMNESYN